MSLRQIAVTQLLEFPDLFIDPRAFGLGIREMRAYYPAREYNPPKRRQGDYERDNAHGQQPKTGGHTRAVKSSAIERNIRTAPSRPPTATKMR